MKSQRGDFIPSYYAGCFHKKIILLIFDGLPKLDYILSRRGTIRCGTSLVMLLRKS